MTVGREQAVGNTAPCLEPAKRSTRFPAWGEWRHVGGEELDWLQAPAQGSDLAPTPRTRCSPLGQDKTTPTAAPVSIDFRLRFASAADAEGTRHHYLPAPQPLGRTMTSRRHAFRFPREQLHLHHLVPRPHTDGEEPGAILTISLTRAPESCSGPAHL